MASDIVILRALQALEALPPTPAVIHSQLFPQLQHSKDILKDALSKPELTVKGNEIILVVHSCILAAICRVKEEFGSRADETAVMYVLSLEALIGTWPLKEATQAYHMHLEKNCDSREDSGTVCPSKEEGPVTKVALTPLSTPTAEQIRDATATANLIFRYAEEAMKLGEKALVDGDRKRCARAFHCAVM